MHKLDLIDQRFGKLLVTAPVESTKDGSSRWECLCDCGTTVVVFGRNLGSGNTTSCGCARGKNPKPWLRKRPYEALYTSLVGAARYNHRPLSLTYEEFFTFTETIRCHYCARAIVWKPYNCSDSPSNLDRKDNALGYTKDNCVVCCWTCNQVKGNRFSYEEMLLLAPALQEIRESRLTDSLPSPVV